MNTIHLVDPAVRDFVSLAGLFHRFDFFPGNTTDRHLAELRAAIERLLG